VGGHREARQPRTLNHCLQIAYHRVHRKVDGVTIGEAAAATVVPDQMEALCERLIDMGEHFPYRLHVAQRAIRHHQQGRAIARSGEGDVYAVARLGVLDARLHGGEIIPPLSVPRISQRRARSGVLGQATR
jgi:hypothetical protein